jgi:hypothetical protein
MPNNVGYEVAAFAPEVFLFGSNGGGEAFAFDKRRTVPQIVSLPFIPMDMREAILIGSNFVSFLRNLSHR